MRRLIVLSPKNKPVTKLVTLFFAPLVTPKPAYVLGLMGLSPMSPNLETSISYIYRYMYIYTLTLIHTYIVMINNSLYIEEILIKLGDIGDTAIRASIHAGLAVTKAW